MGAGGAIFELYLSVAAGKSCVDQRIEEVISSDEEGSFYEPDEVVKIRRGPRTGSNRKVDIESDDEDESDDMKKRLAMVNIKRKLSPALADIVGGDMMPYHEVSRRMWAYFKNNNLMAPEGKQMVVCDEKLKKIFPTLKFNGFRMMTYLKYHINV